MSFDISLSFDTAEYLNPELYMFFSTLENNIPDDTIIHIITNRESDDEFLTWLNGKNFNLKFYHKDPFPDLKSRCNFMFHCFEVDTDKKWLIKMEADMLILDNLSRLEELLDDEYDLILEPENRKIFDDNTAEKLWRIIYRAMNIRKPNIKIRFRENNEEGLPLFGTGMVIVKSKLLETINNEWHNLIKICESWIDYNIHPNEFAFTGLVFKHEWKWKLYDAKYKFNPIGHFRDGPFPSTKLKKNSILPDDVLILDYHRPEWLMHMAKYNRKIMDIIDKNRKFIPDEWWGHSIDEFQERN